MYTTFTHSELLPILNYFTLIKRKPNWHVPAIAIFEMASYFKNAKFISGCSETRTFFLGFFEVIYENIKNMFLFYE